MFCFTTVPATRCKETTATTVGLWTCMTSWRHQVSAQTTTASPPLCRRRQVHPRVTESTTPFIAKLEQGAFVEGRRAKGGHIGSYSSKIRLHARSQLFTTKGFTFPHTDSRGRHKFILVGESGVYKKGVYVNPWPHMLTGQFLTREVK